MVRKYKSLWLRDATPEMLETTLNDNFTHGWTVFDITPFLLKNSECATYFILFKSGQ
jgi:hypothetical protein